MDNFKLRNGVNIPKLIIGTSRMDRDKMIDLFIFAFEAGIRGIDTARDYDNEKNIGKALKEALKVTGLNREDIFLTTKIGNNQQRKGEISNEIDISLDNLQTEYIDLWLMHWPYPDFYLSTWEKMLSIYEKTDKVKSIGVANYNIRHLDKLKNKFSDNLPLVNQFEFHPLYSIKGLREYMEKNSIQLEAYAPFCQFHPDLKNSEILKGIARKYNKTIGQIILRWHIQNNSIPVFLSNNTERFKENVAIFDFSLEKEDLKEIEKINKEYKYHLESVHCPGY